MVQGKVDSANPGLSRREFLKGTAFLAINAAAGTFLSGCAQALSAEAVPSPTAGAVAPSAPVAHWREVKYYEKLANKEVRCLQCPRRCRIELGSRGFCATKQNQGGKLYLVVYGRPCIARPVPVEKAPIFHMLPGTQTFSMATAGCNLACLYCQNYSIARAKPEEVESFDLAPEVAAARATQDKCQSITFTYAEASIAFPYLMDVVSAARARGLKTILKTGGYINPDPLKEICAAVDAINVDLKGFSERFYEQVCQGELKYVLETIQTIHAEGKAWLEVANLVVPTYNDDPKMIAALCRWFKDNLGTDVPLYFTRFEPAYRLRMAPTPVETLERARQIALDTGLKYVYVGNVPGHKGQSTYCPRCTKLLIERIGFEVKQNHVVKGTCKFCGEPIAGRWVV